MGIKGRAGAGEDVVAQSGESAYRRASSRAASPGRSLQHCAARLMMSDQRSPVAKSLPTPFCRLVRQEFPCPPSRDAQQYSLPTIRPPGRISARTSARRGCKPSLTV